jgi:ribonuclease HII
MSPVDAARARRKPDPAPKLWAHDRRLAASLACSTSLPSLTSENRVLLCGVDEVGRGPLAGAVVAACVVLDLARKPIRGVHDSKQLAPERREELAPRIREEALAFGIGEASVEEIDTINIYHASFLAMRRALDAAAIAFPDLAVGLILVDGNRPIPQVPGPQRALIGGDARSASIAAASILAKVVRDHALTEADALYPHYGFIRHKGYATPEHLEALRQHGPCPLHRRSFAGTS